jgi:HSP20 family protein
MMENEKNENRGLVPFMRNFGIGFPRDFFDDWGGFGIPAPMLKAMNTDIAETDKNYELKIDLPMMQKGDIKMHIEDGSLIISAAHTYHEDEKAEDGKTYKMRERSAYRFSRAFELPEGTKDEDVHASFANSTLTVVIDKHAQPEEKHEEEHTIPIN